MRLARLFAVPLAASLCCSAARADEPAKAAPPPPATTEDQLVASPTGAKFAPVTTPGIPPGAESSLVGVDPATKGGTAYVRFSAGMTVPMHWHSYAEYSVVLSGKATLTMDGKKHALAAGSYAVIPAKIHHELTCDKEAACVLLTRRAGPADYTFVK
jgi:quercetin dioxygenase-like cupin family protein